MRRSLAVVLLALGALGLLAGPAAAHPLGNFTTNTAAAITVEPDAVVVASVLDLAEVPALQTLQRVDADRDGTRTPEELAAYRSAECAAIADQAVLEVDGRPVALAVAGTALTLPPGEAGLSTLRLECRLVAATGSLGRAEVRYRDTRDPQRIGWREVTATGAGMRVQADVPATSASDGLRRYPEDRLQSPADQREATLQVAPSSAAPATGAGPSDAGRVPGSGFAVAERLTASFTGLVARQRFTAGFAVVALLLAAGLGTLHALAPGHGKTVMAAYLVGSRGSRADALALGGTVAVTHTAGVLLLGLALTASQGLAPERLYPVLGAVSGLLFAAVGATLLRSALQARRDGHPAHHHGPGGHTHGPAPAAPAPARTQGGGVVLAERVRLAAATAAPHDHDHDHHHHEHEHASGHHHPAPAPGSRWRRLVLPGLAGGLVPSPSALLVLLGGIALGRAWFGVALVVAYGVGMAATLVGAGLLLLAARTRLERRRRGRPARPGAARLAALTGALPVVTAALIVAGGAAITLRSLLAG